MAAALAVLALSCSGEPLALDGDVMPTAPMTDSTRVSVSITTLASGPGGEREKEIYVVALYTDGNAGRKQHAECEQRQGLLLLDCGAFTMVASPVYKNITVESAVSLSGSGIILYPNRAPNGHLMVHVFVIESDKGAERIVGLIEEVAKGAFDPGEAGPLSPGSTFGAVGAAAHVVLQGVKKWIGQDDALLEHTHSGFDYNGYGTDSGSVFVGQNRKVCMELKVVATGREAEGTVPSQASAARPENSCKAHTRGGAQHRKKSGQV